MQPPCLCLNLHLIHHSTFTVRDFGWTFPVASNHPTPGHTAGHLPSAPHSSEQMSLPTTSWEKQKATEGTRQCSTIKPMTH